MGHDIGVRTQNWLYGRQISSSAAVCHILSVILDTADIWDAGRHLGLAVRSSANETGSFGGRVLEDPLVASNSHLIFRRRQVALWAT
jgi:hypothetical protein